MHENNVNINKKVSAANICGWLSLLCWLPYLTFAVAGGRIDFPHRVFVMLLYMLFASPFVGFLFALVAATKRRWWLVLAVVWLAALLLEWWDMSRHPFDL